MFNTKNKSKGQVLVLVALSLVVFLGFAALAIDLAYFFHTRHQLQGAADAGALAGAALLKCENYNGPNAEQLTARNAAHEYAFNNIAAGQSVDTKLNTDNDPNGDIVIGHWDGTNFTPEPGAPLQNGALINAVKVVPRRTSEPATDIKAGGNPVSTFFGKIFNVQTVNIKSKAIAQGCVRLAPISVNEYWMGNFPVTGSGDCKEPAFSDPSRDPYGVDHVYPNSFVRPPCDTPGDGSPPSCNYPTTPCGCKVPLNGNVFANYTFTKFKTKDCNGNTITPEVTENGPLLSVNCTDLPSGACDGRPSGMFRAGRVFAIVGGGAYPNKGSNMHSLLYLDERIPSSKETGGSQQWYAVSGEIFTINSPNKSNADSHKSDVAGHIASGVYPNKLPISVPEVFQPGYGAVTLYTADEPYASISFVSGQGVVGQMVKANFWDNGNFSGGKYAPGEKIIVTVYDGIVGGVGGNQERTTIVGFARVTICGYGNKLEADSFVNCPGDIDGPENTLYGYIETVEDFKPTYTELVTPEEGRSRLVQ